MANPEKKPDNILAAQEEEPELVSPEVQVELDKRHCWNDSPQRERNGQALKMRLVIVRRHHAIVLAVERNKYVTHGTPAGESAIVLKMREKRKDSIMPHLTTILSGAAVLLCMSPAAAQNAPATFRADPSVYKLLYEDQNIRVVAATWAKGVHDKPHSHPNPSVAYALDDCTLRVYAPDGTTTDITNKAGSATEVPITRSHSAENIGPADCHVVFVEHK